MKTKGGSVLDDQTGKREMVVTIDRRLFYALGLVVAFGIAVGGGFLVARRSALPGDVAATVPGPGGSVEADATAAVVAAQQTAAAAFGGNPDTVNVVPNPIPPEITTPDPNATPDPLSTLDPTLGGAGGKVATFEIPQDATTQAELAARYKTGEVLANVEDPNVMNPDYAPLRAETVSKPIKGPRLAITDLNLRNTYDFGTIAMDQSVKHTFKARNVGTENLVISQVYTGCGCTTMSVAGKAVSGDGKLDPLITLRPGAETDFTIEYDASRENREGAVSKYVQIFTNDPDNTIFDATNPNSHETRFRIVVEPTFKSATVTPTP
jgi:hypothetical protein